MPEDLQRKNYWGVTRWGEPSGDGDRGKGLWSNKADAEIHAQQLLKQGWDKSLIEIEEIHLNEKELVELQKKLQPPAPTASFDEVQTGPRGGRYRINSNGRKSYDVP